MIADGRTVARYRAARRDQSLVVLEGLHALKHALRFGAEVLEALSPDPAVVRALTHDLAPDVEDAITELVTPCDPATFGATAPRPLASDVIALARRPRAHPIASAFRLDRPLVVLHQPRHPGNLGAVVRVAAAMDAAGVLVHGDADPWSPAAVRGAAGLQFALPCARLDASHDLHLAHRRTVAFAAGGIALDAVDCDGPTALLFGSERHGLRDATYGGDVVTASIPMRAGVSSLNLATAVAIALAKVAPAG